MKRAGKKVMIGLSGGVDSSVSAALLKKQGCDVTGVFIKTWTPPWLECTWKEDRVDAMRVCAKLDIPFITLDLEKKYKRDVVDYMVAEYRAGRTPNPDVMCNKYIKFGGFFDWAMKNGAAFVATGHYARIKQLTIDNLHLSKKTETDGQMPNVKCFGLFAGSDPQKDQSYFLWTLTQKQLAKTIFPVGGLEKPEVRKLAKKFGLPTADKKDSQGLCFMGKVDVKEFLSHYIKPKRGEVLDVGGREIGYHNGAVFLTIGERRGFTITKKTPNDLPFFVLKKDVKNNTITVGSNANSYDISYELAGREVSIKDANWIAPDFFRRRGGKNPAIFGRVRYRQPLQPCRLALTNAERTQNNAENKALSVRVVFNESQITAAGQSLVLYSEEKCLGGGVIF